MSLSAQTARPNIIHILADDLGWGSVGYNGQAQIATPNLDAIASAGMRFTNAYASPVCAPTRAMLLTGMHQGHASVDGNDGLNTGFRAEDVMTAQVLAPAGYTSAIFGKWGFGSNGVRSLTGSDPQPAINLPNSLPTNHGFDEFYGYLSHGAAHDYFYDWMWQDDADAPLGVSTVANNGGPGGNPQYTHDLFAARSEQFVADHAADQSPFYMQVNYAIPHWDIDAIASAPGGYGIYASQPWSSKEKAYAAMITRMDASIGSLITKLHDPNGDGNTSDSIAANTLVLITSDNGPTVEDDSNAATALDSTHITGASMRARFASIAGSTVDPTGRIEVQGDLLHLSGGTLAIDLGGNEAGVDYDTMNVFGKVELEGDLVVSLADLGGSFFAPAAGDSFEILTAASGIAGEFANIVLPQLSLGLRWHVDYLTNVFQLSVVATGDFNGDEVVDAADYVVWRKQNGTLEQYSLWRASFGTMTGGRSAGGSDLQAAQAPEPAAWAMLLAGTAGFAMCRGHRRFERILWLHWSPLQMARGVSQRKRQIRRFHEDLSAKCKPGLAA